MKQHGLKPLCSSIAGLSFIAGVVAWTEPSSAMEPGNFGQTMAGGTIGAPIAAPAPPGVYFFMDSAVAPTGAGVGQNLGTSETVARWTGGLFWSTGFHVLGANWTLGVEQPISYTATYPTRGATLGGNGFGPPFGNTVWFQDIGNPQFTPVLLQWTLGHGWFAAAGLTLIAPIGSAYNGTLNPDYFTVQPRGAIAYLGPDWHVTANLKYDINAASKGHTGTYQIAANLPFPLGFGGTPLAATIASIGNGYRSGDELFLDVGATRMFGNLEIGPVASFKWQTTADTPGGGFSCAQLAAMLLANLRCGRSTNVSVGGLVGYNFGPVDLQLWATDSVYARDDFNGWGVFTRLSFRIWGQDAAPVIRK